MFAKKKSTTTDKKSSKKRTTTEKASGSKAKATKKSRQRPTKKRALLTKFFLICFSFGIVLALVGGGSLWAYSKKLTQQYQLDDGALGGALWELPSRVYARPLDLYVGKPLTINDLTTELGYLNYLSDPSVANPGSFYVNGKEILIHKNAFGFWDAKEPEQLIRLTIQKGKISDIMDMKTTQTVPITRLEPLLIGSIYPKHGQDRNLISLDNTPTVLIDTVLAAEDRRFFSHQGIDPKGLLRALYMAVKNRKMSQGASTLTQQFVKNHYLNNERRLSRKVKEALIALILEQHYSKEQILEGYLNEIFLGQDGSRAIHGFGLASEFYFGKPLGQLGVHQIASLVALVREPSRANPFRHPDFAKRRRALILDLMVRQNLIAENEAEIAKSLPLDVIAQTEKKKQDRYFSFLQLVKQNISQEYDSKHLAAGLNIFTTLDPIIQDQAERAIASTLPVLEERHKLQNNFLQAASVVVNSATAEIVAIVGDRDPKRHGFNRAFQARRQPGSLLKPVVYMAALEYPQRYTLATRIDDSPLSYRVKGEVWEPKNYSRTNKESVALIDGLVHSYNIPTARIALDIGIDDFIRRLQDLGARQGLPTYPSTVLGSLEMSPLEIAQIYESLANGGYRMPLRAIRSVTDADDNPINRYPMESLQVISNAPYYLTITAMQQVVKRGTARRLREKIPSRLNIAGKTGTTDDYRDSWFAGFSGNYLNVVWVGNDDNKKTGLSGSKGAMRVWMDIMKNLPLKPLNPPKPNNIVRVTVDMETGLLRGDSCEDNPSAVLPFIRGTEPVIYSECYAPELPIDWESQLFLNN